MLECCCCCGECCDIFSASSKGVESICIWLELEGGIAFDLGSRGGGRRGNDDIDGETMRRGDDDDDDTDDDDDDDGGGIGGWNSLSWPGAVWMLFIVCRWWLILVSLITL